MERIKVVVVNDFSFSISIIGDILIDTKFDEVYLNVGFKRGDGQWK